MNMTQLFSLSLCATGRGFCFRPRTLGLQRRRKISMNSRCDARVLQSHHPGALQLNRTLVRQTGSRRCIKLADVNHDMATRQPTLCKRVQALCRLLQRRRQRQLPVHSCCSSNSTASDTARNCHTKVNKLLLIYTMRQTNLGAWASTKPFKKYRVFVGLVVARPAFCLSCEPRLTEDQRVEHPGVAVVRTCSKISPAFYVWAVCPSVQRNGDLYEREHSAIDSSGPDQTASPSFQERSNSTATSDASPGRGSSGNFGPIHI
jgi:hypothetical protein